MIKGKKQMDNGRGGIRFLFYLALSFFIPYSAGMVIERAMIKSWENYGFTPVQARQWWDSGIRSRRVAISWRSKWFEPAEAAAWRMMKIPPDEAREWKEGGFSLAEAMEWRRYAFAPYKASEWKKMEFALGDAIAWRKHSFEPEEAGRWRGTGVSPMTAAEERSIGRTP